MGPRKIWSILSETYRRFRAGKGTLMSGAIAFYATLSLPPLLFIMVWIAGLFFGSVESRRRVVDETQQYLGTPASRLVDNMIDQANAEAEGWTLVLGTVILLYAATRVFAALQDALNALWKVGNRPRTSLWSRIRPLLRKRFISFIMILVVGLILIASMLLKAGLAGIDHVAGDRLPSSAKVYRGVELGSSLLLSIGLFALMYRTLPDVKIRWSSVWPGAVLGALLFNAGNVGISTYLGYVSTSSLTGAAGSLVVILMWVYYSANVFFIGAVLSHVYALHRGDGKSLEDRATKVMRLT